MASSHASTTSTRRGQRSLRTSTGLALAAVSAATVLAVPAFADPASYNVKDRAATAGVTADALPTTQIDGVAWSQQIVGNTVYVGGEFSNARPAGAAAGTNLTPRANMLAYDLTTGDLVTSFQADTDAAVKVLAVSPDKSRVYVGGSFTSIQGQQHYRLAAIDTATGKVVPGFAPVLDSTVQSIAVTNNAVYFGGAFSKVNGVARSKVAAVDTTGKLLSWAPSVNAAVQAMTTSPDQSRVIIGGTFSTVNGSTQQGSAALDASTGATLQWDFNKVVHQGNANAGIFSLTNDGTNVIATGFSYLQGMFEGAALINPNTGKLVWMADCHGDSYGATATAGLVYVASHEHNCDNIGSFPQQDNGYYRANAFTYEATSTVRTNSQAFYTNYAGNPAPTQIDWFPNLDAGTYTGQNQGPWTVTSNSQYVVYGGEFTKVNSTGQQGLVRFAVPAVAPKKMGPQAGGAEMTPTATVKGDTVNLTWKRSWDRDNEKLTYLIYRDDRSATPAGSVDGDSLWWDRPNSSYTDTGLTPAKTYTYWVVAVDPDGNRMRGNNVTVTAQAPTPSSIYTKAVLADSPQHYWRLGESSGNQMADQMGANNMTNGIGVGRNQAGVLSDDKASWFDGALGGWAFTNATEAGSTPYSAELWFKTTSSSGGVLMSMGNAQRYTSSSYDRDIYLTNDGRVAYALNVNGTRKAVTSTGTYRNGQWHHVVSTVGAGGMKLYVDGQLVASDASVTQAAGFTGYWRLGGDSNSGLPNKPAATYTNVTLDEVALYQGELSAAQVLAHYQAKH